LFVDMIVVVGSVVGSASGLLIMTTAVLCLILLCMCAHKKSKRGEQHGQVWCSNFRGHEWGKCLCLFTSRWNSWRSLWCNPDPSTQSALHIQAGEMLQCS